MPDTETGFVLPVESASSTAPQTIPGLPGIWTPGEAQAATAFGLTVTEMRDLISDLNVAVEEESAVDKPAGDWLDRTGGMFSSASADSEAPTVTERSASDVPGLSAAEAEARAIWDEAQGGPQVIPNVTRRPFEASEPEPEPEKPAARKKEGDEG
jgi:hypothetical protein